MTQSDPEISKLVKQAERIKLQEQRAQEKTERKNAPKIFPSMDMESLGAYRALYPHPPTVIWLFGFLISISGFIASLMEDLFPNARLIFGGLTILFVIYGILKGSVMPIIWYAIHRGWRKRLSFTLNGWDAFGSTHLRDSWQWRDLTITFDTPTTGSDFQTALNAAMVVLCKNIANVTYEEDVGEPSRHEWKWDSKKHMLVGSANSQVLGLLSEFFRGSLTDIVKSFTTKMIVTINPDGDWYHVKGKPMGQIV